MRSTTRNLGLGTALAATLIACGGDPDAAGGDATVEETTATKEQPGVPTTSVPADPCGWIPVSEVEAVIGKLAEPPKRADGCRYTMVLPEAVSIQRQERIALQERTNAQLKAAFEDYEPVEMSGSMAKYEHDPRTYAVTLKIDVSGNVTGELGTEAAAKKLGSWMPPDQSDGQRASEEPATLNGWDALLPAPYGFAGRIGHIQISVLGEAPDVPREVSYALATRMRDRIPDLPFPVTNPYQIIDKEEKHPCELLTRGEAEAVLGPLIVEPYRSSSYFPPLAHGEGQACAYFTAGHHVFVLAPTWTSAEQGFKLEKGAGELIGMIAPQEKVVFKGPWDGAQVGIGGDLQFLKGDRLLTVHYRTSSTDQRGAVKLAAQAIQRM